jgi:hypothetical protein
MQSLSFPHLIMMVDHMHNKEESSRGRVVASIELHQL